MPEDQPYTLSAVTAFLNEKESLAPFCRSVTEVMEKLGVSGEIILVDDGSTDGSVDEAIRLHQEFPHLRLISLSRNFGQMAALAAGLRAATGDGVITLDADLQHPPALFPELVRCWREDGYQIVNTVRRSNVDYGPVKCFFSRSFYRVFSRLSNVDLKAGATEFRLLDRRVVDELIRLPEYHLFLRGLVAWLGFKNTEVEYEAPTRQWGDSKYPLRKSLHLAIDGITSFSTVPLKLVSLVGFVVTGVSSLYLVYALVRWLTGEPASGWASLIVTILFLGGTQLLSLGIIGHYLGRVYGQVKGRPPFVIAQTHFFPEPEKEN